MNLTRAFCALTMLAVVPGCGIGPDSQLPFDSTFLTSDPNPGSVDPGSDNVVDDGSAINDATNSIDPDVGMLDFALGNGDDGFDDDVLSSSSSTGALNVRIEPRNGIGLRIWANGERLLVDDAGAGLYMIGSNDNTDDGNNVASFVGNNAGVMRPMNGDPTPYIPYSFTFQADPNDSTKMYFNATIGPSPFNFTTISMPLDGRMQKFTHFRYAGSNVLSRYDQILTNCYTPPGGQRACIKFAPGSPMWGEMIGPDYSIRITLTNRSRPMSLAFVSAPGLSTGVRNIEFGFVAVAIGQTATVSGYVHVARTNPPGGGSLTRVYQTESSAFHQIGRPDGDGYSVRVGDQPLRYMNYGPYETGLAPGSHTATFRLMLDNTTADNNRILRVDVADAGRTIAYRDLRRRDFKTGNFRYQDFNVNFNSQAGQLLEFRTYWYGGSYVRQDQVRVR